MRFGRKHRAIHPVVSANPRPKWEFLRGARLCDRLADRGARRVGLQQQRAAGAWLRQPEAIRLWYMRWLLLQGQTYAVTYTITIAVGAIQPSISGASGASQRPVVRIPIPSAQQAPGADFHAYGVYRHAGRRICPPHSDQLIADSRFFLGRGRMDG